MTDIGGPAELMQDGITGLMVRGHDVRSLQLAMEKLMDDALRARMGSAARTFAVANRVDQPFTAVLDSDAYRRKLRRKKRAQMVSEPSIAGAVDASSVLRAPEAANELVHRIETAVTKIPVAQPA